MRGRRRGSPGHIREHIHILVLVLAAGSVDLRDEVPKPLFAHDSAARYAVILIFCHGVPPSDAAFSPGPVGWFLPPVGPAGSRESVA